MSAAAQKGHNQFGNLPVWDLDDLYPGQDSAEFKAGLDEAKALAAKFEADYKGKLADLTRSGGLIKAIRDSEALGDLTGRIGSFSFLQYAQRSTDANRAKFMGDTNEALTALSTRVLFFELELNRIEDADLEAAFDKDPELARYRTSAGERVLMAWRRGNGIEVTDRPSEGRARGYLVDRGFRCIEQLASFVGDYVKQAARLDACPMSREAISQVLGQTETEALAPLFGEEA